MGHFSQQHAGGRHSSPPNAWLGWGILALKMKNDLQHFRRIIRMPSLAVLMLLVLSIPTCVAVFGYENEQTGIEGTVSETVTEIEAETDAKADTETDTEARTEISETDPVGQNEMLTDTMPLKTRIRLVVLIVAVAAIAVSVTVSIADHAFARAALCVLAVVSAVLLMSLVEIS